ncbi:hypothetical protein Peur_007564 [Populus x canadensis]
MSDRSSEPNGHFSCTKDLGIKILQSCNVSLLCSSSSTLDTNGKYHIYNPTTEQFLTLNPSVLDDTSSLLFSMSLTVDLSCHCKVLCVPSSHTQMKYQRTFTIK